jgi:hypothetical protein
MNQPAAQASQAQVGTTARALVSAGAFRRAAGAAVSGVVGSAPFTGLAAVRGGTDRAVIQVLAGRPW